MNVELHVCADASTIAYGACAYLRVADGDGGVYVTLVMSKCKIMPVRTTCRVASRCHGFHHWQLPDECA